MPIRIFPDISLLEAEYSLEYLVAVFLEDQRASDPEENYRSIEAAR